MTVIANTEASELAARAMLNGEGIRGGLELTFRDVELEDVHAWAAASCELTRASADDPVVFASRFTGAIAAAMVMGAKLAQTGSR